MTSSSRKSTLLLGALIVAGLALLFTVPFHFPPPATVSESYLYGYNNRLGELIFMALAGLVWWVARSRRISWPVSGSRSRPLESGLLDRELPGGLLVGCLLLTALLCAFFTWVTYRGGGVGDGAYFLDRIHLIARGEVPYRDFEFVYGSFPLYTSLWLGRLFGCGGTGGFYILWTVETLLGVLALWFALRLLDLPAGGKRTVFFLLFFLAALMTTGPTLNYVMLRYSLPFLAVCLLPHLDRASSLKARWLVGAGAVLTVVLLLGLSPEEGLAFSAAFLFYLPLRRSALRRPWIPDTLLLALALLVLYGIAARGGEFRTLRTFGAGAFNLPLLPGVPLLLFFAAFLLVLLMHASGTLRERAPSNLALALLYGFCMLPGALGRADAIHLLGYELPLVATAMLLTRLWPAVWRITVLLFSLSFYVYPMSASVHAGQPTLSKALMLHLYANGQPTSRFGRWADAFVTRKAVQELGADGARRKIAELQEAAQHGRFEPGALFPGVSPVVMTPFQYLPNKLSVYQSPAIDEGYYMGLLSITSPAQLQQKIDELRRHPERDLLVSNEGMTQCVARIGDAAGMRALLQTPYVPPLHAAIDILSPMCVYLNDNYHWIYQPADTTFGYGVLRHNAAGS